MRRALIGALVALAVIALGAREAQAREIIHIVRKGQYLALIAKRYHTSAEAIRERNKLRPKQQLRPGQQLVIVEEAAHARWRRHWEHQHGRPAPEPAAERSGSRSHHSRQAEAREHKGKRATSHSRRRAKKKQQRHRSAAAKHAKTRDRYARKPRRRGYVTMMRFGEKFAGRVVDSRGRTLAVNTKKLDRLLRSRRTGDSVHMKRRLLRLVTGVSDHFGGRVLAVVSGYRPYSPKQYTRDSRHNHGAAIDFRIVGVPNKVLFNHCRTYRNVGCGYYPNSTFVHMDVRNHKTHWIDYSRPGRPPIYAHRKRRQRSRPTAPPKTSKREASASPAHTAPSAAHERPTTPTPVAQGLVPAAPNSAAAPPSSARPAAPPLEPTTPGSEHGPAQPAPGSAKPHR